MSASSAHIRRSNVWLRRYGPWAVVTGASQGIGREVALTLAARGCNLILVARDNIKLKKLENELNDLYVMETRVVSADLSTEEGASTLFKASSDVDVGLFVASAGCGSSGGFADADIDSELAMIDLNVRGIAEQIHHFANRFRFRGCGGIVLFGSIVGWQGVPRAANYAATKAYVQTLAEGLSRELRKDGVDVLASAPAQVETGFMQRANMRAQGVSPKVVAVNTINALGKRTTVYPHFKSYFLSTALSMLPRRIRVRILEKVMAGMTRHQLA